MTAKDFICRHDRRVWRWSCFQLWCARNLQFVDI